MVSREVRIFVRERAEARCEYCRAPEIITGATFHIEHVLPACRGGSDEHTNLALSCSACNGHKADHTTGLDPEDGREVGLFNPRRDRWGRHFQFSPLTLHIAGISAKGRATVSRLRMNERKQMEARSLWVELELYP